MPILFAMYGALRYMANEQLVKQTFDLLLTGDTVLEPFLWVKNLWMPDSPFNAAWPNLTGLQMVEEKQWLTIFNSLTPDQMAALGTAIGIPDLTTAAFAKGDALNATVQAIGNALSAMPEYIEQTSVIPYLSIDLLITKFSVVANYNGYFVLPILSAVVYVLSMIVLFDPKETAWYIYAGLYLFISLAVGVTAALVKKFKSKENNA